VCTPSTQRGEIPDRDVARSYGNGGAASASVDGVDEDTSADRLDSLCDLVEPAQDRAWEIATEQVVAADRQCDDACRYWCTVEVGEHAVRRVAVAREVDQAEVELARELRRRTPTAHARVVVDGDAVP
jgi:hypothetical protein